MKKKNEAEEVNLEAKKEKGFLGFLLVSGLLAWIITLSANAIIFVITLFFSQESLVFSLVFFAISVAGQILFLKRR